MTNCCSNETCNSSKNCPECGSASKTVAFKTVLHQLKFPDVLNGVEGDYYFCSNSACSLAYFSLGLQKIYKKQLSVFDVTRAEKLCYCFDVDKELYIQALAGNKAEEIKQFVVQRTQAKLCACEVKNPSGRCCLVDFKKIEVT